MAERPNRKSETQETDSNRPVALALDNCLAMLVELHSRKLVTANRAVQRTFGATTESLKAVAGRRCHEVWGFSDEPCPWCVAQELWDTGRPQCASVERQGKSWAVHWLPLSEELYFHFAYEIGSQARREQDHTNQIRQLESKNRELELYAHRVAHDLKSPLVTISGFVSILRADLSQGDLREVNQNLEQISRAADRMSRLLNNVLELSRLGQMISDRQRVPLDELAAEVLESLSGQLESRHITVALSPNLPVLWGDRQRLAEVVQNLIENSIKYLGDQAKPCIEIDSRRDDGQTICFVRDNGIGIEPADHERVFERFTRIHGDRQGSGLGLAIVRRIIEAHEGRVWIESKGYGEGTTVCFAVPDREQPST